MSLQEKVGLTSGVFRADVGCDGNIAPIQRLGFPGLCLADAGQGLRNTDFVNSYPSGIHVGASWNKDLAQKRAAAMGGEYKTKGVNVLLGPVVGPAGRVARGGRNWEGFSIDPYLSGALVYETVEGIQGAGVITSTKHYIGNEQESYRMPASPREALSSNIDDRTLHELYLWPFQDALKAGTGNIMCSYQRLNNSYSCHNSKALNGLLKTELGFQGFVVTDWGAQHAGVAPALAGLDMAMPNGFGFWEDHLLEAVNNGSVPESRVTDMATRIIATWYHLKQDTDFPAPGFGKPANPIAPHSAVDVRKPESRAILFDGAVEGHVLVKNEKNALPLKSPRLMGIFGYSAKSPDQMNPGPNGVLDPFLLGGQSVGVGQLLTGITSSPGNSNISAIGMGGTIISGGGSGATSPSNLVSPFEALKMRAYNDGTAIFWDFTRATPDVDPATDVCLVFGNAWAAEGNDRPGLRDDYTDNLIKSVASKCNNTIVVIHNAGPRLVDSFVDNPNVTAIILAHLPGQDTGPAVTSILYGDTNPSGKLPYTLAKQESDYYSAIPDGPEGEFTNFPQSNFDEGVYVDYRYFDQKNIEPRYEFGFGLSYTTFNYSNLQINRVANASTEEYPTGEVLMGGQTDLWDIMVRVSADVSNTGNVTGAEVAQLYLGIPNSTNIADIPIRQLRGFEKPVVNASSSVTVEFPLTRRDLSFWDVVAQKWRLQSGTYKVFVGSSSRKLPLEGEFVI